MHVYVMWGFNAEKTELGHWDVINYESGEGAESLIQYLKSLSWLDAIITHHPRLLAHACSPFTTVEESKGMFKIKLRNKKVQLLNIKSYTASNEFNIPVCEAIFEEWESIRPSHSSDYPLTAVQLLRTEVKNCMFKKNNRRLKNRWNMQHLDEYGFLMYQRAKQGGLMYSNPSYQGITLSDVHDYDKNSAYTAACLTEFFPKDLGTQIVPEERLLGRKDMLSTVILKDVSCNSRIPYIYAKKGCVTGRTPVLRNNRVLEADRVIITVTAMDWECIKRSYKWSELEVIDQRRFKLDMLPIDIRKIIYRITLNDITLKGVPGKEEERARNKILKNSITGMFGEDIKDDPYVNPFWYVWLTAYVRNEIYMTALDHERSVIYINTDGIAMTDGDDEYFEKADEQAAFKMIAAGFEFPAKIPGCWSLDIYHEYRTLGINKEYRDGEIKLGGYNIKKSRELIHSIDDFKPGFKGIRDDRFRLLPEGRFDCISVEQDEFNNMVNSMLRYA